MEYVYSQYVPCGGAELFTVVCLPATGGRFPTVVYRRPYVDDEELLSDAEVCERKRQDFSAFLKAGYAVVFQHCRGRGKSGGDCIP